LSVMRAKARRYLMCHLGVVGRRRGQPRINGMAV
jgi:hypothetical protein